MRLSVFYMLMAFGICFPMSAHALCPCPVPPFTYCTCCPPPCPIADDAVQKARAPLPDLARMHRGLLSDWQRRATISTSCINNTTFISNHLFAETLTDPLFPEWSDIVTDQDIWPPTNLSPTRLSNQVTRYFTRDASTQELSLLLTQETKSLRLMHEQMRTLYATAITARAYLPTAFSEEMEAHKQALQTIITHATNATSQAGTNNSVEALWRLNSAVRRSLEKHLLMTEHLMNTWLHAKTLLRLASSSPHHVRLPSLSYMPAWTAANHGSGTEHHACMTTCDAHEKALWRLGYLLSHLETAEKARTHIAGYAKQEKQAMASINQHKRVYAEIRMLALHLERLLGTLFQDGHHAFVVYSKQLLTSSSPFFDNTEFIDNVGHEAASHTHALALHQHMLGLGMAAGSAHALPLEEHYGPLISSIKECVTHSTSFSSSLYCPSGQMPRFIVQLGETLYSDDPVLYPASLVELRLTEDTPHDDEQQEAADALIAEQQRFGSMTPTYDALDSPPATMRPTAYYTTFFPSLTQATRFWLEALKYERYLWYFRYGNNVEKAITAFGTDPERYEAISPLWYRSGGIAWWENLRLDAPDHPPPSLLFDASKRTFPAGAPASRFTYPHGAEGMLSFITEMKKWLREASYQALDQALSESEIARFGHYASDALALESTLAKMLSSTATLHTSPAVHASTDPLYAYIETDTGFDHAEWVMLQLFFTESDHLAKSALYTEEKNLAACGCKASPLQKRHALLNQSALQILDHFVPGNSSQEAKKAFLMQHEFKVQGGVSSLR